MATSLRNVSENYHLTMKRAQIASSYLTESLSERSELGSESARENPIGARGVTTFPVEVRTYQRSRSSFTPLPWEGIYPSGLYTAIVHNGPLRTRIQDHLDEPEELKAHVRRAQELLFGWLVTLYHLMLVVTWYALESTIRHIADLYKRHVRARISWIPCTAWIKQAMRLAVAWFLPTLLTIRKSVLEANSRLRSDLEVNGRPRSSSEAKRMSLGPHP